MPDDLLSQILIYSSPLFFALLLFLTLNKSPEQRELEAKLTTSK
jgi:YbbR domain-containing protein